MFRVELAAGVFVVVMAGLVTWMAVYYRRRKLVVYYRPQRPPAPAAVPGAVPRPAQAVSHVTHHHYDERQLHIHVTQPPPGEGNAESIDQRRSYHPPAITPRQPVPGVVLSREEVMRNP